jgi:hypothetical protein
MTGSVQMKLTGAGIRSLNSRIGFRYWKNPGAMARYKLHQED